MLAGHLAVAQGSDLLPSCRNVDFATVLHEEEIARRAFSEYDFAGLDVQRLDRVFEGEDDLGTLSLALTIRLQYGCADLIVGAKVLLVVFAADFEHMDRCDASGGIGIAIVAKQSLDANNFATLAESLETIGLGRDLDGAGLNYVHGVTLGALAVNDFVLGVVQRHHGVAEEMLELIECHPGVGIEEGRGATELLGTDVAAAGGVEIPKGHRQDARSTGALRSAVPIGILEHLLEDRRADLGGMTTEGGKAPVGPRDEGARCRLPPDPGMFQYLRSRRPLRGIATHHPLHQHQGIFRQVIRVTVANGHGALGQNVPLHIGGTAVVGQIERVRSRQHHKHDDAQAPHIE